MLLNLKIMWKKLMIIALVCGGIQWILLGVNIAINGHFNWVVFPQAILWSVWAIICLVKFRQHYA